MKICSKCKRSDVEFNKDSTKRDGLRFECKTCQHDYYISRKQDGSIQIDKNKKKEYDKEYRQINKEKRCIQQNEYRKTEIGKLVFMNYRHNRRAKIKLGSLTVEEWNRILDGFNNSCAYCNSKEDLTMDHIIPLKYGGEHLCHNIVPACLQCYCSKSSLTGFEAGANRAIN